MATFPGDMNVGWGFGLETREETTSEEYDARQKAHIQEEYPLPADPLLAVSELERRINDLTEQLGNLTFVVNELVMCVDIVASWQMVHDACVAEGK